nr:hypothetical protein MarFTME_350 [Marseillevirus futianmevirus]
MFHVFVWKISLFSPQKKMFWFSLYSVAPVFLTMHLLRHAWERTFRRREPPSVNSSGTISNRFHRTSDHTVSRIDVWNGSVRYGHNSNVSRHSRTVDNSYLPRRRRTRIAHSLPSTSLFSNKDEKTSVCTASGRELRLEPFRYKISVFVSHISKIYVDSVRAKGKKLVDLPSFTLFLIQIRSSRSK